MYQEILMKIGLTKDQSSIYSLLLKEGSLPAGKIAVKVGIKRGLCYKILDQLIEDGLVEKIDKKVALFGARHPSFIKELIAKREEGVKNAQKELEGYIGSMVSDFNMSIGEPYIEFKEGLPGIQYLYDDINTERKDILLLRSPYDSEREGFGDLIMEQIKKQVRNNIHTRAITPAVSDSLETSHKLDKERLIERRLVPREILNIPGQIIIYGDKVAITSFKEYLITTIIYNPDIRETFEKIFEFMWSFGRDPQDSSQKTRQA